MTTSEELFVRNCLFTTLHTGTLRKSFKNKNLTDDTNERLNSKANKVSTLFFGEGKIVGDPASIITQAREVYTRLTFPFDNSNSRVCPIGLFPKLVEQMKKYEERYAQCIYKFLDEDNYQALVDRGKFARGDDFRIEQYMDKYYFVKNCADPVFNASDPDNSILCINGFRFNAFQMPRRSRESSAANHAFELLEAMKEEQKFEDDNHYDWLIQSNATHCLQQIEHSLTDSNKGLIQSLEKKLGKLVENPDAKLAINEGIFENVRSTLEIVESMNITNNIIITEKVKEVRDTLNTINTDTLRELSTRDRAMAESINKLKDISFDCDLF